MNANDQAPRNTELTDGQPVADKAAADRENDRHARPGALRQDIREEEPRTGFWDLLSPSGQAALQSLGQVSVFRPGDVLCTEGAAATHVLVLTEGWVKVSSATREHHQTVLALRGKGDIVGELAGDGAGYRNATVVAAGRVRAIAVSYDMFGQFLESSPEAARAYRRVVTQRWREAADMLRSRAANNGAERLAGFLLDLVSRHGTPGQPGTVVTVPLSHDEIAGLIGVSRATVTRALHDWRHRGLIGTARHQVTIMNTPGLRSIAEGQK